MKTLFVLLACIIFVLFFSLNRASCYDYSSVTPQPCLQDSEHPWNGPYSYRVCNVDVKATLCDPNCCWTFIYYERFTGAANNEYELIVTAVFHDGASNCDECDLAAYTYVMTALVNDHNENILNFKQRVMSTNRSQDVDPGWDTWIYTYSTAKCFDANNLQCGDVRCCRYKTEIKFAPPPYPNNRVASMQMFPTWTPQIIPTCPPSCSPVCFQVNLGTNPDDCKTGCESGSLLHKTKTIPIPGCSPCTITFTYSYRSNDKCTPPWQDYQIEMPIILSSGCENCFPNGAVEIHGIISNWLLTQSGDLELPAYPKCSEYYRITSPPCVTWYNGNLIYCLNNFSCCKTRYRLCWDGTYTPLEQSEYTTPCNSPCIAFCGIFHDPTIFQPTDIKYENQQLNELISLKPNPSKGIIEIEFNSNINKNFELIISNVNGDLIINESLDFTIGKFNKKFDLSKNADGMYFYEILFGNKVIKTGNFIILK